MKTQGFCQPTERNFQQDDPNSSSTEEVSTPYVCKYSNNSPSMILLDSEQGCLNSDKQSKVENIDSNNLKSPIKCGQIHLQATVQSPTTESLTQHITECKLSDISNHREPDIEKRNLSQNSNKNTVLEDEEAVLQSFTLKAGSVNQKCRKRPSLASLVARLHERADNHPLGSPTSDQSEEEFLNSSVCDEVEKPLCPSTSSPSLDVKLECDNDKTVSFGKNVILGNSTSAIYKNLNLSSNSIHLQKQKSDANYSDKSTDENEAKSEEIDLELKVCVPAKSIEEKTLSSFKSQSSTPLFSESPSDSSQGDVMVKISDAVAVILSDMSKESLPQHLENASAEKIYTFDCDSEKIIKNSPSNSSGLVSFSTVSNECSVNANQVEFNDNMAKQHTGNFTKCPPVTLTVSTMNYIDTKSQNKEINYSKWDSSEALSILERKDIDVEVASSLLRLSEGIEAPVLSYTDTNCYSVPKMSSSSETTIKLHNSSERTPSTSPYSNMEDDSDIVVLSASNSIIAQNPSLSPMERQLQLPQLRREKLEHSERLPADYSSTILKISNDSIEENNAQYDASNLNYCCKGMQFVSDILDNIPKIINDEHLLYPSLTYALLFLDRNIPWYFINSHCIELCSILCKKFLPIKDSCQECLDDTKVNEKLCSHFTDQVHIYSRKKEIDQIVSLNIKTATPLDRDNFSDCSTQTCIPENDICSDDVNVLKLCLCRLHDLKSSANSARSSDVEVTSSAHTNLDTMNLCFSTSTAVREEIKPKFNCAMNTDIELIQNEAILNKADAPTISMNSTQRRKMLCTNNNLSNSRKLRNRPDIKVDIAPNKIESPASVSDTSLFSKSLKGKTIELKNGVITAKSPQDLCVLSNNTQTQSDYGLVENRLHTYPFSHNLNQSNMGPYATDTAYIVEAMISAIEKSENYPSNAVDREMKSCHRDINKKSMDTLIELNRNKNGMVTKQAIYDEDESEGTLTADPIKNRSLASSHELSTSKTEDIIDAQFASSMDNKPEILSPNSPEASNDLTFNECSSYTADSTNLAVIEPYNPTKSFCNMCNCIIDGTLTHHASERHTCISFVPLLNTESFRHHMKERVTDVPFPYSDDFFGNPIYVCRECNFFSNFMGSVRIHFNVHQSIYLLCNSSNSCMCRLRRSYKFSRHKWKSLLQSASYLCSICQQLFVCKEGFLNHMKIVHQFSMSCCDAVSKQFEEKYLLSFNICHANKIIQCENVENEEALKNFSWITLNNHLNHLDGKCFRLNMADEVTRGSMRNTFQFPIDNVPVYAALPSNLVLSPAMDLTKYSKGKFLPKVSSKVGKYIATAFDFAIQILMQKRLTSTRKSRRSSIQNESSTDENFFSSLGLLEKREARVVRTASNGIYDEDISQSLRRSSRQAKIVKHKADKKDSSTETNSGVLTRTRHEKSTKECPAENSKPVQNTDYFVEISGEWGSEHTYVCCSCGTVLYDLADIMDHKWESHPGVWCAHTMIQGKPDVPDLFCQQYLPAPQQLAVLEIPDACSDNKEDSYSCSHCHLKFKKLENLHIHVVECGGLNNEIVVAKKKSKKGIRFRRRQGQGVPSRRYGSSTTATPSKTFIRDGSGSSTPSKDLSQQLGPSACGVKRRLELAVKSIENSSLKNKLQAILCTDGPRDFIPLSHQRKKLRMKIRQKMQQKRIRLTRRSDRLKKEEKKKLKQQKCASKIQRSKSDAKSGTPALLNVKKLRNGNIDKGGSSCSPLPDKKSMPSGRKSSRRNSNVSDGESGKLSVNIQTHPVTVRLEKIGRVVKRKSLTDVQMDAKKIKMSENEPSEISVPSHPPPILIKRKAASNSQMLIESSDSDSNSEPEVIRNFRRKQLAFGREGLRRRSKHELRYALRPSVKGLPLNQSDGDNSDSNIEVKSKNSRLKSKNISDNVSSSVDNLIEQKNSESYEDSINSSLLAHHRLRTLTLQSSVSENEEDTKDKVPRKYRRYNIDDDDDSDGMNLANSRKSSISSCYDEPILNRIRKQSKSVKTKLNKKVKDSCLRGVGKMIFDHSTKVKPVSSYKRSPSVKEDRLLKKKFKKGHRIEPIKNICNKLISCGKRKRTASFSDDLQPAEPTSAKKKLQEGQEDPLRSSYKARKNLTPRMMIDIVNSLPDSTSNVGYAPKLTKKKGRGKIENNHETAPKKSKLTARLGSYISKNHALKRFQIEKFLVSHKSDTLNDNILDDDDTSLIRDRISKKGIGKGGPGNLTKSQSKNKRITDGEKKIRSLTKKSTIKRKKNIMQNESDAVPFKTPCDKVSLNGYIDNEEITLEVGGPSEISVHNNKTQHKRKLSHLMKRKSIKAQINDDPEENINAKQHETSTKQAGPLKKKQGKASVSKKRKLESQQGTPNVVSSDTLKGHKAPFKQKKKGRKKLNANLDPDPEICPSTTDAKSAKNTSDLKLIDNDCQTGGLTTNHMEAGSHQGVDILEPGKKRPYKRRRPSKPGGKVRAIKGKRRKSLNDASTENKPSGRKLTKSLSVSHDSLKNHFEAENSELLKECFDAEAPEFENANPNAVIDAGACKTKCKKEIKKAKKTRKKSKCKSVSKSEDLSIPFEEASGYLCLDCGLTFDSALCREDHRLDCKNIALEMSMMVEESLYECPHCQLTFALKGTQRRHSASCRGRKPRKSSSSREKRAVRKASVVAATASESSPESALPPALNNYGVDLKDLLSQKIEPESFKEKMLKISQQLVECSLERSALMDICSLMLAFTLSTSSLRDILNSSSSNLSETNLQITKGDPVSTAGLDSSILERILIEYPCKIIMDSLVESVTRHKRLCSSTFAGPDKIHSITVAASRADLLKALCSIEDLLKETERLENLVKKQQMLLSMKEAFQAGTGS